MLPQEMGCGSGSTCWRCLRDWQEGGVWRELQSSFTRSAWRSRPDRLGTSIFGLGERTRQKGGEETGLNPTDKGKPGSKRHLVADRRGGPLAVILTAANVHDSNVFEELVDAVEPIKRPRGRPRKGSEKLHADQGYDAKKWREALKRRGIKSRLARKGVESSQRLGRHRWVVERTLMWVSGYRRLALRYERRADIREAYLAPWLLADLPQLLIVRVLQGALSSFQ